MAKVFKKTLTVSIIVLLSLFLFSCSGEPDIKPTQETSIEKLMDEESRESIKAFGSVLSIKAFDDPTLTQSKSVESEARTVKLDKNGVKSTYYLVEYESIPSQILDHLSSVPKEAFRIPGLNKNKIDLSANYIVLFRSSYFEGKDKAEPAFRDIYLLDKDSIENNGNVLLQYLSVSPDFAYDIENELEIATGEPKKYNWTSGTVEVANHFAEDTTTDFSPLFEGNPEIKAWIFVTPENEPVTETHSAATYILEVDKDYVSQFFDYRIGSFTSNHLRIKNFTYEGEDKVNKAYLVISKYPEGYIHDWEAMCYWHDGEKWNYIQSVQTDDDLQLIWYKDITQEEVSTFFDEAKRIGNITRIYQAYKGNNPLPVKDSFYRYVVEFNSVTEGSDKLLAVIANSQGKYTRKRNSSWAGALNKDTIASAYIHQRKDNPSSLSICIHVYDSNKNEWYTSYVDLNILIVDDRLVINSKFLDDGSWIYYENQTGKYQDISNYDGSFYYCEYEGDYNLDSTLAQLGTFENIVYYTGETGQTKPYITTFSASAETYVSVVAQYSTFNQSVLESSATGTRPQNPYFTHGYSAYDVDYENDSLTTVELDVFFDGDGSLSGVQIRKLTDRTKFETREYATTYEMKHSFLLHI